MLRSVTDHWQRWRDRARRRIAIWLWDRPNRTNGAFQDRIVFIRWDAKLGDTIVLSWVFREIKRQRPDLEIVVITAKSFEDLFRTGYGIDSVYLAGKRHGNHELKRIAKQLVNPRYVVHLGLKWRPRDIWFVRALDPEYVVGLDDELDMVNVKLGRLTEGRHFSEKLVPFLQQIGLDTSDRRYWVPRLPEAEARVDQWWPKGRVVGLCPYGASRKKRLHPDWIEAIVKLICEQGVTVVFLVLPSDREVTEQLIQKNNWKNQVFLNLGESSQFDLFEQVARCDAIVSVDTAVVHLAVGLQRPLLALYNSMGAEFANWHPNSEHGFILRCKADMNQPDNGLLYDRLERALSKLLA